MKFADHKIHEIQTETAKDPLLNLLKEQIHTGWPEKRQQLAVELRQFWSYRDLLSVNDGIIHKGEKIFVPTTLCRGILENLQVAYQGITKTQLRARQDVYWPNINDHIGKMCQNCTTCQKHQISQSKEPTIHSEVPPHPIHTIGSDLFQIDGETWLIIVDYFSKYPFLDKMPKSVTSEAVAEKFEQYTSMFGNHKPL